MFARKERPSDMLIKLSEYSPNFSLFDEGSMTPYYKDTFLVSKVNSEAVATVIGMQTFPLTVYQLLLSPKIFLYTWTSNWKIWGFFLY